MVILPNGALKARYNASVQMVLERAEHKRLQEIRKNPVNFERNNRLQESVASWDSGLVNFSNYNLFLN
jgi:hypothetical protein